MAVRRKQTATLPAGAVFAAGANLWEVKPRPSALDLETATATQQHKRSRLRAWMLLLPALSLTWILSRFLGVGVALGLLAGIAAISFYIWAAVRSQRRPQARWGIIYGLELPARPATRGIRGEWTIDLSPAPTCRTWRAGPFALIRPKFKRGHRAEIRTPATLAVHNAREWTNWILAQALTHARLDGIDAHIPAHQPDTLVDQDENVLLTVATGARGDYVLECPSTPLLTVSLPTRYTSGETATIPRSVLLSDLPEPSENTGLRVPIGFDEDAAFFLDLVNDGPHALVAGTTGSGKSEALRTWIIQLARLRMPQQLRLVLIDYKGGAAFRDLVNLKHVEGLLTDLEPEHTARAIAGLSVELAKREEALASRGFSSLNDWERADPASAPARIVCVIDEFRAMIRTHPDTLDDLIDLAARGRSLGMHLIAATQSPGGVVTPAMRANLTLRICLRTADLADSMEVLGTAHASELPRLPGRSIVEIDEPRTVQWAFSNEAALRKHLGNALSSPRKPRDPTLWKPALPPIISPRYSAQISRSRPAQNSPQHSAQIGRRSDVNNSPGTPFAWVDDVTSRDYQPLAMQAEPIAAVGSASRIAPIISAAAGVSGALVIRTNETDVNTAANLLDHATRLGQPVVIDNLGDFIRQTEIWGIGAGNKWWQKWLRTHQAGLVAGVDPEDYNLVRSWPAHVLALTSPQARALALPRETVRSCNDTYLIFPWNAESSAPVSLVDTKSADGTAPQTFNTSKELKIKTKENAKTVTDNSPTQDSANVNADSMLNELVTKDVKQISILGSLDKNTLEQIREYGACRQIGIKELTEIELVSKRRPATPGVLTIVGEAPAHVLSNVQVPPYVSSESASNSAYWAGMCDAWYRLARFS